MRLRAVRVEDAVGRALAHDVTRIVPGRFRGPAYRRGHVIRAEDTQALLDPGKEHTYVPELEDGDVHGYEASVRPGEAALHHVQSDLLKLMEWPR
jgi:hypothetical protein